MPWANLSALRMASGDTVMLARSRSCLSCSLSQNSGDVPNACMILVQALRLHLAEGAGAGIGWIFALADKQMSAAITAMHADPAHRWTLQELAERAGMSRSSFAQKFKETVGDPPLEYLTRWRMLRAGDRLVHSGDPVAAIALSLGYESESAFSTGFKRVMGSSPRHYSRGQSASSTAQSPESVAA
jgi:AraC-like DNA-binding protein